ncbi:fibronectin type III domain-containing protein [Robertkochia aurantiaca]|uniref:fibronectin type III domain-containing protein n=1 Tax=Robertkochia aurantiaca TaxID=2873700 RepID=UPI001CC9192C|nr:fibronectin type III domain-containing protein [Robertkochia sp. 3YJGBD-33]
MNRLLLHISLAFTALFLISCGGDDPQPPQAASLVFPEDNTECLEGVVSSSDPGQSTITFSWQQAAGATSYNLIVRNLNTNISESFATSATSFDVTLERGVPYSWQVESLSRELPNETAVSQTFRFYNAGEGVVNYAPFPAELIFPASGATVFINGGDLNLQWSSNDVDGDLDRFRIILDTTDPPLTQVGESQNRTSFAVSGLQPDQLYYWRIVSIDEAGNESVSEVSEFIVR